MFHKQFPTLTILICLTLVALAACGGKASPPSHPPLIAFSYAASGNSVIYTMNPDGSGKTALTSGTSNDHGPLWWPEGNYFGISSNLDKNFKP